MKRTLLIASVSGLLLLGGTPREGGDSTYSLLDAPLSLLQSEAAQRDRDAQPRIEELIRHCMRDRGFRYVPIDHERATRLPQADLLTRDEFRHRFAYGVVARVLDPRPFRQPRYVDPNEAIRAALSPSLRAAYSVALYGDESHPVDVLDGDGELAVQVFPSSCIARAQAVIRGPVVERARASALLDDEMAGYWRQVENDALLEKSARDWAACMEGGGFRFRDPNEITSYLLDRLAGARGPKFEKRLEQLRSLEVSISLRDQACQEATERERVLWEIRSRRDAEFVERHGQLIEEAWF
ncbi:MAG TPA: hypothetical protein VEU29_04750 [Actinomycetota bacterium]|nr:hypothetical protein [Actinomycetota bacterium]